MNCSLLRKCGLLAGLLFFAVLSFAQQSLKFKLQLMPDGQRWGVYVKPVDIYPSLTTIAGSAQVTVVMPLNYSWDSLISVAGTWQWNAYINGPAENPNRTYVSFGMVSEFPHIDLQNGQETLLFTFRGGNTCPNDIRLIDNNDPFLAPNSVGSNPMNEMTIFDPGGAGYALYEYGGNYAASAWDCHDNDNDGILNAHEDTNGNGVYDAGVDASDLNNLNETGIQYKLQLMPDGQRWGVYAKPVGIMPSLETIVGSAQVTVVMPLNYSWNSLISVAGAWQWNAYIDGPAENPNRTYFSFGMVSEFPHIDLQNGQETLLFTFKGSGICPDSIHLIDNHDPFLAPNSIGSNPGNEITVYDPAGIGALYIYNGIYAPSAWSCHDNDNDGILNSHEDTNGNGVYDAGVDASDLNTGECDFLITDEPDNVIQCSGEAVSFSAIATMPNGNSNGLFYQWEETTDGGNTWHNVVNDTIYHGANTNTLGIAYTTNLNAYCYRLKVWRQGCVPIYSNPASSDVEGPMTVIDQPDNITQCAGEGASFQAVVAVMNSDPNNLIYQWEYSTNNGVTWQNIPILSNDVFSGENTNTLNISDVSNMFGWRLRMRYRLPSCNAQWTNYAHLTVEGPISFTNHPDHVVECTGNPTAFVVQTNNSGQGNITYQWQICVSGDSLAGPWLNLPNTSIYNGSHSPSLSLANTAGFNGYYYRCLIQTSTCSPIASYAARLTVEGPITMTSQPTSQTTCQGEPASFSASATTQNGSLQYQWQMSSDGVNYANLTEGGTNEMEGTDSPTLNIGNSYDLNGMKFRLAVKTSNCNNIYSQAATLSALNCNEQCLKLKLQALSEPNTWSVMAKPFGNYVPTKNARTMSGRVTVVAPADFNIFGHVDLAGAWAPVSIAENVPGHPGKKFLRFELVPNLTGEGTAIPYLFNESIPLFTIYSSGPCPDSLYLLENVPSGLLPNELACHDFLNGSLEISPSYCGVYGRKAWRCKTVVDDPVIAPPVYYEDSLTVPDAPPVDRENTWEEGKEDKAIGLVVSPNPASNFLNVAISEPLAEGRPSLLLHDLQGKKRMDMRLENSTAQLDLAGLPPGVYFLSLMQNGRVLQREKVLKH